MCVCIQNEPRVPWLLISHRSFDFNGRPSHLKEGDGEDKTKKERERERERERKGEKERERVLTHLIACKK